MRYDPYSSATRETDYACNPARFPPERMGGWLAAVVDSTLDGVIVIDRARHIVLANEQAGCLFGVAAETLVATLFDDLLPAYLVDEHRRTLEQLAAARLGGRRLRIRLDSKGLSSNGDEFPFDAAISRVRVRGELFFSVVMRGLPHESAPLLQSNSPPAEDRRRGIHTQQLHEVEKRRFSRVLYDDLGQSLSVLKLDMDWLQNHLRYERSTTDRVAQMQGTLDGIIARVKNIASTLRPPLLDDFGLAAALQWVADEFQKKTGIRCRLTSHGTGLHPGDPIESATFRIVQESLLNIEQHAKADQVTIALWRDDKVVGITVSDNGIGIASGSEKKSGCYGLLAMQERIYTLGGRLYIHNLGTEGVAIHASIPIGTE